MRKLKKISKVWNYFIHANTQRSIRVHINDIKYYKGSAGWVQVTYQDVPLYDISNGVVVRQLVSKSVLDGKPVTALLVKIKCVNTKQDTYIRIEVRFKWINGRPISTDLTGYTVMQIDLNPQTFLLNLDKVSTRIKWPLPILF